MNSKKPGLRRFHFVRTEDPSGVSGTGVVGEGVELSNGKVVHSWISNMGTVSIYDNMKTFVLVHGHDGKGTIEWLDPDPTEETPAPKPRKRKTKS